MTSALENALLGKNFGFHGGVHPEQHKTETNNCAIADLGIPEELIIPLKQHSGAPGEICVKPGERVLKGQPLTLAANPRQIPVHAPTSGTVIEIGRRTDCHPSGIAAPCIVIKTDGKDESVMFSGIADPLAAETHEIIKLVSDAGIVGLGGAGFPAGRKINFAANKSELLIINGCECEPYLTSDDRTMRECAGEITLGIEILAKAIQPKLTVIAIEDNKPEAIECMRAAIADKQNIEIRVLPTIYPTGAARPLIRTITGKEVGYNARSNDFGVTMHNVSSALAVKRAVADGKPLTERIVTVTGDGFERKGNFRILLGTPLNFILERCGYKSCKNDRIIMGGPMMGFTAPSSDIPTVKTLNCIIAPSERELPSKRNPLNCIKCGECQRACPSKLRPYELLAHGRAGNFDAMLKCNFEDCIECGCCSFVCPSGICLVETFRKANAAIRKRKMAEAEREIIKFRTDEKNARIKKEEQERKARMDALKQKAREQMNASAAATPLPDTKENAASQTSANKHNEQVAADSGKQDSLSLARAKAAALAAAKAKTANADNSGEQVKCESSAKQDALAIARAKAAALAAAKAKTANADNSGEQVKSESSAKQDALALARAKAAALAAAKAKTANAGNSGEQVKSESSAKQDALAIARAKAAALAAAKAKSSNEDNGKNEDSAKQDAVALARAKAAALAAAKENQNNGDKK